MATIRDEAVCVRHWDWSETSQTVSLLTREHGMLRGVAKGSKREKGPFSGGIELLTRGEVVAIVKSSGAMATLTAWDLLEPFPAVRSSLGGYYVGSYMADLTGQMMREGDPHPRAFDALVGALRSMSGEGAADPALLAYQWALLAECGYAPELARDARTGGALARARTYAFAPQLGGFVSDRDPGAPPGWRVRAETLELLREVARGGSPGTTGEVAERANRLLAAYAREVLGHETASMAIVFGPTPRAGGQ